MAIGAAEEKLMMQISYFNRIGFNVLEGPGRTEAQIHLNIFGLI